VELEQVEAEVQLILAVLMALAAAVRLDMQGMVGMVQKLLLLEQLALVEEAVAVLVIPALLIAAAAVVE
jgi:hypothetical protein